MALLQGIDMDANLLSSSLFCVLGLLVLWMLYNHSCSRKARARLPPGRTGWPLIGETLDLIAAYRTSNPEPFADSRRARYGSRVFRTHLLGKPTIFSTDPEMNKFVLQNEGRLFASSYPQTLACLLGRNSLLLTQGHLHKQLYALTWSFTNSSILREHLMADIESHVCATLSSWHDDALVHIQDEAKKITFNLSVDQLLSASPGPWTESLREEYLQLVEGFFSLPINLPGTTYGKALQARAEIARRIKELVDERRRQASVIKQQEAADEEPHADELHDRDRLHIAGDRINNRRRVDRHHDLLAALLRQNMDDRQIVDMVISLLVAGYETTSMIMTLAVKFLTDHPAALERLRAEHESIRARKQAEEKLHWTDYKSMSFTQCVINEALRMGNVVGGVFRKALQDVEIPGGFTVPKGWVVFSSFRAVHFDEATYEDARTFNPWRWPEGVSNSGTNSTFKFTPFGGGPRFCPGYELARVEISVFLYYLTTQFRWQAEEEDELIFFPTTRMVKRLPLRLQRRRWDQ